MQNIGQFKNYVMLPSVLECFLHFLEKPRVDWSQFGTKSSRYNVNRVRIYVGI